MGESESRLLVLIPIDVSSHSSRKEVKNKSSSSEIENSEEYFSDPTLDARNEPIGAFKNTEKAH